MSRSPSPPLRTSTSSAHLRRGNFEIGVPEIDMRLSSRPPTPELPGTPDFRELSRNLSIKSLRDLDTSRLRASVWRPSDEQRKHPRTFESLWIYAVAGGSRAFLFAWSVRAGLNLFVTLLRNVKKGKLTITLIQRAIFADSAIKLGRVFGAFTFAWRILFYGLRLYNVGPRGKLQQERWHAPVAGALSGLCVLLESPVNRAGLAQQMLVRGLQGSANRAHNLGLLRIPYGNIWTFGAANTVIMGCFVSAREALDKGYYSWIAAASHAPKQLLDVQQKRSRGLPLDPTLVEQILGFKNVTPKNARYMRNMLESAAKGGHVPPFGPCAMHHPAHQSCLGYIFNLYHVVFRWILPIYLGLNFVPPLLLKRKMWLKQPLTMASRSLINGAKSSAFLATFVLIFQSCYCGSRQIYGDERWPESFRKLVVSRKAFWVYGFLTCGSLLLEDERRRTELALYCLPKSMEALWNILRRRRIVPHVPFGTELLAMAGMGMVMDTWVFERESLSSLVRAVLWQTLGP